MSVNNLGMPFDIHTGGVDLKFPHHENEIAQSTAGKGDVYAQSFFHSEHMLVDGKKMSKSLDNFHTLQDVREHGFEPLAFRLMILQSHYRNQSNFTWENLEAAQNRLQRWREMADRRWQVIQPKAFIGLDNLPESEEEFKKLEAEHPHTVKSTELLDKVRKALEDDLNTPEALSSIDAYMDMLEKNGMTSFLLQRFNPLLQYINQALGIDLFTENISADTKKTLEERQKARDDKDWAKSDELRDQLKEQGIGVRDTAHGQIWYRA
jgi:cysteinyl-tRNA synthetase